MPFGQPPEMQMELAPMVTIVVWPAMGEMVVTVSEQPPGQLVTVTSVVVLTVYV